MPRPMQQPGHNKNTTKKQRKQRSAFVFKIFIAPECAVPSNNHFILNEKKCLVFMHFLILQILISFLSWVKL